MRLKATTIQTNAMGMGNKTGSYAGCLMAAFLLAACDGAKVCQDCNGGGGETCSTSPTLVASAGDGEVTLRWRPAVGLGTAVKAWQFRQAGQGQRRTLIRSTGPAARAYVVSGLENDVAYTFQVRTQLDVTEFGCWSAPVSVVPRRIDDVMAEMAKQQRAIAERMADLVNGMAASQDLLQEGVVALKEILTAGNEQDQSTHEIRHTTFAFRFAPPWFNADQRSLFTSYVVFPEAAKFEEWIDRELIDPQPTAGQLKACDPGPASVCPDDKFYEKVMGPFLEGLSQCATTKKVQLDLVGFASSTGLSSDEIDESKEDLLQERYGTHIADNAELCLGEGGEGEENEEDRLSNMFNLLIANERAVNAATMFKSFAPKRAFAIKAVPWCSHGSMEEERDFNDGGNSAKSLLNRRVEVRLAALPGCLNVDPTTGST